MRFNKVTPTVMAIMIMGTSTLQTVIMVMDTSIPLLAVALVPPKVRKLVPPSPLVAVLVPPKTRSPAAELVVVRKPRSPAKVAVEAAARMEKANLASLRARPVENVLELVNLVRKPRNLAAVPRLRSLVLPSLLVEALAPQRLKSLAVELVAEAAVARKPRNTKNPRRLKKVT